MTIRKAMNVSVDVSRDCGEHWTPAGEQLEQWSIVALEVGERESDASLSLRFVDVDEARQINARFRHKDYATNVLSFPADIPAGLPDLDAAPLLGDIVICPAVVEREAQEQDKPLVNHWAHLLIHGVLHLLGYDHLQEQAAQHMESLEIEALQKLGIPNPYLVG